MNQIWNTNGQGIHPKVLAFTAGEDAKLDQEIFFPYDVQGTLAHAKMLHSLGHLSDEEWAQAQEGLGELAEPPYQIPEGMEDCHSAIEAFLTEKYGELGKKIHTARSRNDQALCMIRLYTLEQLKEVKQAVMDLVVQWKSWANTHADLPMPGYTHMQKAMPTTVGTWQGAYADALQDALILLDAALKLCDQSPLGSGAGFGIPMELDRELTAKELGFSKVQENPIYCQLSRGPFESSVAFALMQVQGVLAKWANDLLMFTMSEFQFFKLPKEYCTSSSIMPQKQNYDALELMRGHNGTMAGVFHEIQSIHVNLHSGYHRDLQLLKAPLVKGFQTSLECLEMAHLLSGALMVSSESLENAMDESLFATEKVYDLVKEGMSFREAYAKVKRN